MIGMSNRIFIDSSVLIEYRKGSKTTLWEAILKNEEVTPCLNQTVVSEYLFHHLAIFAGKSPRAIKENDKIAETLLQHDPFPFLNILEWLPDSPTMLKPTINFMENHNLLPNDALILASCKQHQINALASYDPDFEAPCLSESIHLLKSAEDFEAYITLSPKNPRK
jgi:predicted nucleic acid-binding protein